MSTPSEPGKLLEEGQRDCRSDTNIKILGNTGITSLQRKEEMNRQQLLDTTKNVMKYKLVNGSLQGNVAGRKGLTDSMCSNLEEAGIVQTGQENTVDINKGTVDEYVLPTLNARII